MKITYDPAVDAAYFQFVDEISYGDVKKTYSCDPLEVDGIINLDFDKNGNLIGIEILDASKKLSVETLSKLSVE